MLGTSEPTEMLWVAQIDWEGSPKANMVYSYIFGSDKEAVVHAAEKLRRAVVEMELNEDFEYWADYLGRSTLSLEDKVLEGIDQSIKVKGPSQHNARETYFNDVTMKEFVGGSPDLAIYLPEITWEQLAPYSDSDYGAFMVGAPTVTKVYVESRQEELMTHRSRTDARRRIMRRKAAARRARTQRNEKMERRASRRSVKEDRPRRMTSRRLAELRKARAERRDRPEREDVRRERRLASIRKARRQRRLAELRKERKASTTRRARTEKTTKRIRRPRRTERKASTRRPERRNRTERVAMLRKRREARQRIASAPKRVFVKADNKAGVPAGIYELDTKATMKILESK